MADIDGVPNGRCWPLMAWLRAGAPLLGVAGLLLLFPKGPPDRPKPSEFSIGEGIDLRGGMAALKTVDLIAFKSSLPPQVKHARRLIVVISGQGNCASSPGCSLFPYDRNSTGLPGLWIPSQVPPDYKPQPAVSVAAVKGIRGLPDEVFGGVVRAILVDFQTRTVTPCPGSYSTWAEYLEALQRYESCYKQQL